MTTITIPKKFAKDDLVIIPRKQYEELLKRPNIKTVKMTSAEKREWQRAKKDYKEGKYITYQELKHELDLANKRKS